MQFSEDWLRSLVATDLNSDALCHALTMAGLEVEDVAPVAASFSQVVVGKILTAEKHPDADRLQVCTVDVGQRAPLQIVCGAANARVGILAPCALVGASLPGIAIKQAKVRGVESFGMLCSQKELGISEEATGLLELEADAIIGQDIREYLALDDNSITIKLTPNRADCLSITGIARDVAAISGGAIKPIEVKSLPVDATLKQQIIAIEASQACPKYCGRLITHINAKALTPTWMLRRLARSGIRSISPVVDVTNYVLLAFGQPMHAFDADKLYGNITVRFANKDEAITLLNNQAVTLKADDLVIADNQGAVALAGIMGGAKTAVSEDTTHIFLESAFFTPAVIAGKARRLGLTTDSSYRFERGVDFGNTRLALEYASQLIVEICGNATTKISEVSEVLADLPARPPVKLRLARLNSIIGIPFTSAQVADLLNRLNFAFTNKDDTFVVSPPSYRFDIEIEEDLIEEVARLHGYDHIPAISPIASLNMLPAPEAHVRHAVLRSQLVGVGYQEVVNYSFVDARWEHELLNNPSPIQLQNPIASNLSVMRTSLWGGLIDALVYNLNRKHVRAQFFELGATYEKVANNFIETQKIAGLFYGALKPEQWADAGEDATFFDIKAHVMLLTGADVVFKKAEHSALHPGQTAQIFKHDQAIGWLGKLHPRWQQQHQLAKNTFLFELDVAALQTKAVSAFTEVSKFLNVRRDLAIVIDSEIALSAVTNAINEAKIPLVSQVALFDLYQGKGIAENKKSLALSVLMHDTQRTLTDEDADKIVAILLELLQNTFSATLRN
jgi:phenylalanyl-tRNA synthetase beta chain